jgi:predicted AAA+ superfamily ATPase
MIKEDILKQVLIEQRELIKPSPEYVEREMLPSVLALSKLKHIVVISGHRRAGKSVFLSQIIHEFYGMDKIYYLNLDDERFASLTLEDMNRVMEVFMQLFGKRKIIFLDEVQNLEGWEKFVSRLYNEHYKIYLTGSNAKLLSSELATLLTGRYTEMEIFPFSFREFLRYRGIEVTEEMLYKTVTRAEIRKLFDKYVISGGFPEVVQYGEMSILRNLFSDVIVKDVVARYKVREIKTIKEIALFLISNAAKEFSYNRIKNIYALGSVHTAKNYVEYLRSTYMFFELPRFSHSLKEMHTKIKKVYVVDNGFIKSVGFSSTMDTGRLYENLVFGELKRRGKEVYYYKDKKGKEVDFIIREGKKIKACIQVCLSSEEETVFRRETENLLKAMDEFKLKEGVIISGNREDKIEVSGKRIVFIPLWKWILVSSHRGIGSGFRHAKRRTGVMTW